MRTIVVAALSVALAGVALAEAPEPEQFPEALPPPQLSADRPPSRIDEQTAAQADQQALEPEVIVIESESARIEEYRLNGQLYMVKITPAVGPSYYLVDSDGDGSLESRHDLERGLDIPMWVLFSW